MKLFLFCALLLVGAYAKCPNSCSGHGTCNRADICTCYMEGTERYDLETTSTAASSANANNANRLNVNLQKAWTGADCSLRTCPRGMSWNVMAEKHNCLSNKCSLSDLVIANVITTTLKDGFALGSVNTDEANLGMREMGYTRHKDNVECSDAGMCDRSTGACQCFDGYTGAACQRTVCPNDCSGHGHCFPNTQFATDSGVRYSGAWDSGHHYGCKCDMGFRGADCSLRECPSHSDPMYDNTHGDSGNAIGRDCSGRGICDYSTGLCECFSGYTGMDCSQVLALM